MRTVTGGPASSLPALSRPYGYAPRAGSLPPRHDGARPAPPGLSHPRRLEDDTVRKTLIAAPMLMSLALAPSASALPQDQAFAQPGKHHPRPAAGRAYPVAAHDGQAGAPKSGKTPPKPKQPAVQAAAPADTPPQLQAIASCESGGNPQAVDSTGTYRGKYQFTTSTWQAVGGSGDPAAAPEAEQDRRAAMLYARSGSGQWPVCGQ
jgi:hypothetical protein